MFKGSECPCRFFGLRALHTTKSRGPGRHRPAGAGVEHQRSARPLAHLSTIGPVLLGQTWPALSLAGWRRPKWSKHFTNSPLLALLAMAGRVPGACGYYFGTSPKPSVSSDPAGYKPSKSVFNLSLAPVGLYLYALSPFIPP